MATRLACLSQLDGSSCCCACYEDGEVFILNFATGEIKKIHEPRPEGSYYRCAFMPAGTMSLLALVCGSTLDMYEVHLNTNMFGNTSILHLSTSSLPRPCTCIVMSSLRSCPGILLFSGHSDGSTAVQWGDPRGLQPLGKDALPPSFLATPPQQQPQGRTLVQALPTWLSTQGLLLGAVLHADGVVEGFCVSSVATQPPFVISIRFSIRLQHGPYYDLGVVADSATPYLLACGYAGVEILGSSTRRCALTLPSNATPVKLSLVNLRGSEGKSLLLLGDKQGLVYHKVITSEDLNLWTKQSKSVPMETATVAPSDTPAFVVGFAHLAVEGCVFVCDRYNTLRKLPYPPLAMAAKA